MARDPTLANNVDIDSNKIEDLLIISYSLKTFKIMITIMTITYYTGIFFLIMCEGVQDFVQDVEVDEYLDHHDLDH
jgi:hypothetical protein